MQKSKVALVKCSSYDEETVYAAVLQGLELLGGIEVFIKKGVILRVTKESVLSEHLKSF